MGEKLFPKYTNASITSYCMIYCENWPLMTVIKICEDKLYMLRDLSVLDVVMRNVLDSLYWLLYICLHNTVGCSLQSIYHVCTSTFKHKMVLQSSSTALADCRLSVALDYNRCLL